MQMADPKFKQHIIIRSSLFFWGGAESVVTLERKLMYRDFETRVKKG